MTGVYSAANEQAVAMFLDKKIGYFDMFKVGPATQFVGRVQWAQVARMGAGFKIGRKNFLSLGYTTR